MTFFGKLGVLTTDLAQEKMLDTLFPKEAEETVNVLDLEKTQVELTA